MPGVVTRIQATLEDQILSHEEAFCQNIAMI